MIDHETRMLAVDLQAAVRGNDGLAIMATVSALTVKLSGAPVGDNWPGTLQMLYLLAVVIQHIPSGPTTSGGFALKGVTETGAQPAPTAAQAPPAILASPLRIVARNAAPIGTQRAATYLGDGEDPGPEHA